jgi:hypothetical protein
VSNDNRRFLRVPVSQIGSGVVRAEPGTSLACEVVNASSGGYGITIPQANSAAFPPGRIVVLELEDLIIQMRVAHSQAVDDGYYVGLERIGEVEQRAEIEQKQLAQRQSTLVRNVAIAAALACAVMAYLLLPVLLDQFQGKKKRAASAPAAVSLHRLTR